MQSSKVIWGVVAVVIIGGWLVISNTSDSTENAQIGTMEGEEAMMEKSDAVVEGEAMMEKEEGEVMVEKADGEAMMENDSMVKYGGTYEAYNASKLAYAATGDVVLFFKATWCPSCRAADSDIKANSSAIPSDLTILELDYDKETALKQKYGVTSQHTFVQVDKDGNLIKKWTGGSTLAALVKEVQ